ncbi:MAG: ECF-type sigma factor [Verrucomicrobia bacterium]|nr:ECF-type sigma factor [Verrucomicrobiota bacterium]
MFNPPDNQANPSPALLNPADLHPELYRELRWIAARRMAGQPGNHTLQPTMLVHEAWLRLSKGEHVWLDRGHFLAAATTTMRRILIDNARRKSRQRHGGGQIAVNDGTFSGIAAPDTDERVLLIDEAITELEKVHPERAQVVIARFFADLTPQEIAGSMGIGERTVERHWAAAKVWLMRWLKQSAKD